MKNVTTREDFYQIGWMGKERQHLFCVKPGIPVMDAVEACRCMVNHARNVINAVPAEDNLPETLKHVVSDLLERVEATIDAALSGYEEPPSNREEECEPA